MPHAINAGKTELTVSTRRLIRFVDRMARWAPERRALAHKAAEARLGGQASQEARRGYLWSPSLVQGTPDTLLG
jgi:hypothetical protein